MKRGYHYESHCRKGLHRNVQARQPTKLLASNLEIYDEDHQLLVASSEYVDLDWSKIHA